jgi:hypothetical protein
MSNLNNALADIANRVKPVDLYERSLRRSAQIGRRRAAASIATGAMAVALVSVGAWGILPHSGADAPTQPATAPTVTESPAPVMPTHDPNTKVADAGSELANATLNVPAWPRRGALGGCPEGRVTFKQRSRFSTDHKREAQIASALPMKIDGNAVYVVTLICQQAEGQVVQVVAYSSGAEHALIGVVVATTGEIDHISWVADATPDLIQVELDHQTVDGQMPPAYTLIFQTRFYTFQNGAFVQAGGPSTFAVDPSQHATVTPSSLDFGKAVAGCRTGTMTLTIQNTGSHALGGISAAVISTEVMPRHTCEVPDTQGYHSAIVQVTEAGKVPSFAPGASKTVTVTIVIPDRPGLSGTRVDQPENFVQLRVIDASGQPQYFEDKVPFVITFE